MKINYIRGDLSEILVKKETLVLHFLQALCKCNTRLILANYWYMQLQHSTYSVQSNVHVNVELHTNNIYMQYITEPYHRIGND